MMSAFPTQKSIGANKEGTWIEETPGQSGMTLRDYFAAKAMQGMCANPSDVHDANQETYDEYVEEISRCAYKIADAMMKAREA